MLGAHQFGVLDLMVVVFAVVVIGVAVGYYVVSYSKGRIWIDLTNTVVGPGEMLTGMLRLRAKKEIEGNELKVTLLCRESVLESRVGTRRQWQHIVIYFDDVRLEGPKRFPPGHGQEYSFQFRVPQPSELLDVAPISGTRLDHRRAKWHVRGRLDAKGVDVCGQQRVHLRAA